MFDVIDETFSNDHVESGIAQWYRRLLQSKSSLHCSKISLCLREFARLDKISSRFADTRHRDIKRQNVLYSCTRIAKAFGTTTDGAIDAVNHTSRITSAVDREPYQEQSYPLHSSATARVRNMFKTAFAAVNREYGWKGEDDMLVQLQFWTDAYLEAAVMVEALLGDLRRESL